MPNFYEENKDKFRKELITPYIGVVLDNKVIPQNSKGRVYAVNHTERYMEIGWSVNGKKVCTRVSFNDFGRLFEHKIIDYAENHVNIPEAKFKTGDLVGTRWTAGIVRGKEYRAADNEWWYDLITIEGLLSDDYDVKYTKERESDLMLVGAIGEEVQFKDNKYLITIKKMEDEVRCDE